MLVIDLIRHVNVAGKSALYGCTDIEPIQIENDALFKHLKSNQQTSNAYQSIICSPLQRCQLLAVKFANSCHLPLEVNSGLQEMNFGLFDGVPFDDMCFDGVSHGGEDVNKSHNAGEINHSIKWSLLERFFQHPAKVTLPGGERLADFNQRVVQTWKAIVEAQFSKSFSVGREDDLSQQEKKQRVLVIAHGGVIRMILAHILSSDWQQASWYQNLQISQASLTRITIIRPMAVEKANQQINSQLPLPLHQKIITVAMPLLQENHDRI